MSDVCALVLIAEIAIQRGDTSHLVPTVSPRTPNMVSVETLSQSSCYALKCLIPVKSKMRFCSIIAQALHGTRERL